MTERALSAPLSVEKGAVATTHWIWVLATVESALLFLCLAASVPKRYFVNDDYQQLYTAWLRSEGKLPIRDFGVQSYHILPDLIAPFYAWFGARIETAFVVRWVFFGILLATVVCTVLLARRLLPEAWAPLAPLFALSCWATLERGIDIRPDALSGLLWLSALLLATRGELTHKSLLALGAVLAAALILRTKSVTIVPVVSLLLCTNRAGWPLTRSHIRSFVRDHLWVTSGAACVFALFFAYLLQTDQWDSFTAAQASLARIAVDTGHETGLRTRSLLGLYQSDAAILAAILIGVVFLPSVVREPKKRLLGYALIGFAVLAIAANNAFYAYNLVALMAVVAPLAAAGCARLVLFLPRSLHAAAILLLMLAIPLRHAELAYALATKSTNQHQLDFAAALSRTPTSTTVFGLEGVGLFRPSLYDFRLSAVARAMADAGIINLSQQLRSTLPEIVVTSYRVPGWLKRKDRDWLKAHYVTVAPQIMLRRESFRQGARGLMYVPRTASYAIGADGCEIDGVMHEASMRVRLPRGIYQVHAAYGPCSLLFDWPQVSKIARNRAQYLIPPDWTLYPQ